MLHLHTTPTAGTLPTDALFQMLHPTVDLWIQVRGLASGRSADVSGEVRPIPSRHGPSRLRQRRLTSRDFSPLISLRSFPPHSWPTTRPSRRRSRARSCSTSWATPRSSSSRRGQDVASSRFVMLPASDYLLTRLKSIANEQMNAWQAGRWRAERLDTVHRPPSSSESYNANRCRLWTEDRCVTCQALRAMGRGPARRATQDSRAATQGQAPFVAPLTSRRPAANGHLPTVRLHPRPRPSRNFGHPPRASGQSLRHQRPHAMLKPGRSLGALRRGLGRAASTSSSFEGEGLPHRPSPACFR
jgi:hypothetical protein